MTLLAGQLDCVLAIGVSLSHKAFGVADRRRNALIMTVTMAVIIVIFINELSSY